MSRPDLRIESYIVGNTHQFSILLTKACKLFLWGAQCVQSLHEKSDLFACINNENRQQRIREAVRKHFCIAN